MKRFSLSQEELSALRFAHRNAKNRRDADRLKAVYSLALGHRLASVASILMLDQQTVRNYQDQYKQGGISGLLNAEHKGSECRLNESDIEILVTELQSKIYLTTQAVIAFVENRLGVDYTQSGMRDLLHRIGYEYKKPKLVPGNPNVEAQEIFVQQYQDFMQSKPNSTEVLFLDAVHPKHNAMAAYGWIKRGEKRELKTNSGRERLNLHGAIKAETYQVTLIESDTVNAESTITLLQAVEVAYPSAEDIFIILDNAKYHYSKLVKEYLFDSKIKLVFLPSYSPNLNLIERLWKFFKKKVLYNRYHKNIKDFRKTCIKFFQSLGDYQDEIGRLMSGEFELT